jgi:hypothetical protein
LPSHQAHVVVVHTAQEEIQVAVTDRTGPLVQDPLLLPVRLNRRDRGVAALAGEAPVRAVAATAGDQAEQ